MTTRISGATILPLVLTVLLGTGCAAFRSDIGGAYGGDPVLNTGAGRVSVAFVFTHVRQTKGLDAIPKIDDAHRIIGGFDDFFADALPEISNIGSYATFTVESGDVNRPDRRAELAGLETAHDYVIRMRFSRGTSFARQTLATIASTLTLTLAPAPYARHYTVAADVYGPGGVLIKRYERHAEVTNWVETFLILAYPFHPEGRKTEEVYVAFLHDVFREIEADRILAP